MAELNQTYYTVRATGSGDSVIVRFDVEDPESVVGPDNLADAIRTAIENYSGLTVTSPEKHEEVEGPF